MASLWLSLLFRVVYRQGQTLRFSQAVDPTGGIGYLCEIGAFEMKKMSDWRKYVIKSMLVNWIVSFCSGPVSFRYIIVSRILLIKN